MINPIITTFFLNDENEKRFCDAWNLLAQARETFDHLEAQAIQALEHATGEEYEVLKNLVGLLTNIAHAAYEAEDQAAEAIWEVEEEEDEDEDEK